MPAPPSSKWKPIVFTAVFLVAITLILFLLVHKSNKKEARLCSNPEELMYFSSNSDDSGGGSNQQNGTCYMANTQGPCEKNQILISISENGRGGCDCDNVHNERALVYHTDTKSCYFIFTKAYCDPGEWLILEKGPKSKTTATAKCVSNPCLSLSRSGSGSEWVQLSEGGPCVELGSRHASCKNEEEDVIRFFKFKAYPACQYTSKPHINTSLANLGPPPPNCPPGYIRTHLGHCSMEFDFD